MSIYAQITDAKFTNDMSTYTNIDDAARQASMDEVEQRSIDRLLAHGFSLPATVVVVSEGGTVVVGTGTSVNFQHLIHRATQVDLLSSSGQVVTRAAPWKEDLDMIWGDVQHKRFLTSNFFTETITNTSQRGKLQSMRIRRT